MSIKLRRSRLSPESVSSVAWFAGCIVVVAATTYLAATTPALAIAAMLAAAIIAALIFIPRSRIGTIGACVGLSLLISLPIADMSGIPRVAAQAIPVVLLLVSGLQSSHLGRVSRPGIWLLAGFFLVVAVGSGQGSWTQYAMFAAMSLAVVWSVSRADHQKVMRCIVRLAILQSIIGLGQMFWGLDLPWETYLASRDNELLGGEWGRASGTMSHPLPLALLVLVSFTYVIRDRIWLPAILRLPTLALFMAVIALTGSRSATLMATIVILMFWARKITLPVLFFGGLAATVALLMAWSAGFFQSEVVSRLVNSGSVYHRQSTMAAAEGLLLDRGVAGFFFGGGYDGVSEAQIAGLLASGGFDAVDNQFVTTLAMGGVFAMILITALIALGVIRGHAYLKLPFGVTVGMFFIFDILLWTSSSAIFFALLGMALTSTRKSGARLPAAAYLQQQGASQATSPRLGRRSSAPVLPVDADSRQ